MKKRILALLLALIQCFSLMAMPAYAEETEATEALSIVLTGPAEAVNPGDQVTVAVSFAANPGIAGVEMTPEYDKTVLTLDSMVAAGDLSWTIGEDAVFYSTTNTTYTGDILTLTFTVKEDASAGDYSIGFWADPIDENLEDVAYTVTEATLTVAAPEEPGCDHSYVAGVCTQCGEADPDYVAPSVDVTLSLSRDAEFMVGDSTGEVMAFKDITVPYFDLGLYGLEEYYFISESYGDDGDGLPGSDLEPGTPEFADGKVTLLHLYLYALEVFHCGVDAEDAGKGYLYNEGLIGTDVFSISGGVGSSFMDQFWGGDCNLNYYVNYEYPLASEGWGATADQILLRDGDMITLGHFSGWSFYGDPYSIFNYILSDKSAATQGEDVTLTLMYAGANMGTTDGTAQNLNTYCLDVYCTPANVVTSEDVTTWTFLGTSDENGQLVVDTTDLKPGEYIVAVAGQYGVDYTDEICSTPGGVKLTVKACQHNYVDGVCGNCGAADPNYVAPSNDAVVFAGEAALSGNADVTITELILKDAKDKVFANYFSPDTGNELFVFLDGDKAAVGDSFEFAFTAEGADKDKAEFRILEPNFRNKFTIQSYGYDMGQMQIQETSTWGSVNFGVKLALVTKFGLSSETLTLTTGKESTLNLSTNSGDINTWLKPIVEWTTSDANVATVDGGKVTAVAPGTATITATVGNKTATCTVTVESNDAVVFEGEAALSGNADVTVTELILKDAKDKVFANYFSPDTGNELFVFLDGDKAAVGDSFEFAFTAEGADKDKAEFRILEPNFRNKFTIQSYGYDMGQMQIQETSTWGSVNFGVKLALVTKFGLSSETLTLTTGKESTLNLSTNSGDITTWLKPIVEWTTSDESVATVDGGKVTAVAPGTATITAKVGSKTTACTVTVESNDIVLYSDATGMTNANSGYDIFLTELTLKDAKDQLILLDNSDLKDVKIYVDAANISNGDVYELGYTLSGDDKDQATVTNTSISMTTGWGVSGTKTFMVADPDNLTVSVPVSVYGMTYTMDTAETTLTTGSTATVKLNHGVKFIIGVQLAEKIQWSSSDESVATVAAGEGEMDVAPATITAVAPGTATITATIGNKTATCTVTVVCEHDYFNGICTKCSAVDPDYVAIETIQLTSPSMKTETDEATGETVSVLSLVAGGSEKLTAVLNEGATQGVIWSSENEGIAKVDENGVVTAVSNGTTTITATAGDTATTFAARNNPVMASVKVTVTDLPEGEYYTVTLAEDKTVVAGETIEIPVTVGHSNYLHYNAWDMTFTYDSTALKLTTESSGETFTVTAEGNTIRVQSYGENLDADTTAFALTFEALKAGSTELTLDSAKVDNAGHAIGNDAPEAVVIDGLTVLTITGYPVTLPEGFEGEGVAAPGKDYTFSAPEDYYDYIVEVKVGGESVEVTPVDGTWTIPGEFVTGEIVVTQTGKEGKTFDVDLGDYMNGESTAQHGTDYSATLNKEAGYTYSVTVKIGGETYNGAEVSGNTYTIPGGDITGKIEFIVVRNVVASTDLAVTFTGTGAGAADGNPTTVKNGADYVLTLTKAKGYLYTVKVNGQEVEPNAEGKYVIEKVTAALTIEIERMLDLEGKVSVHEYVNLDGKTVFLVLLAGELEDGNHYTYDGNAMYYSYVYEAWATLTVESGSFTAADASAKVDAAAGNKMTISSAECDVNNTGTVDINDAQLAYDVYKGNYEEISAIGMAKYLWADVNADMKVDVTDAQMVVANIK